MFRNWREQLPASLIPLGVELPGRGSRFSEPPLTSVDAIAAGAADALEPFCHTPYALFGHSLGAHVAYEVARVLMARGRRPLHLFVSGSRAPHLPPLEAIHDLPAAQFQRRLTEWGGIPTEVLTEPELLSLLEPMLRADLAASETYRCESPSNLGIPITVFAGMQDSLVPVALASEWAKYTNAYFAFRLLPGNHFFLHSSRETLLSMLPRELELSVTSRGSRA